MLHILSINFFRCKNWRLLNGTRWRNLHKTCFYNLGIIHIWRPWKLPPPLSCSATSKILPPPWPWASNFKGTQSNFKCWFDPFSWNQPRPQSYFNIKNIFFSFFLQWKDVLGSRLSWSLAISFFVALYSCVCSCPKISLNDFYL